MTIPTSKSQSLIAILADDLTGAAELAGICLRFGLRCKLFLDGGIDAGGTDVVLLSTDSRSMSKEDALKVTAAAVNKLLQLKPTFIYKKIDSVLRGYVLEEVKLQLSLSKKRMALILPANPSLGRTIEQGVYLVNGEKITHTAFASDPEFPARSARVTEIIGGEATAVPQPKKIQAPGIFIGDAKTSQDVKAWAETLSEETVAVGAGDFFTALLENSFTAKEQAAPGFQLPILYVSGTAFAERRSFIRQLATGQDCVAYLPKEPSDAWLANAAEKLGKHQKLIVAIDTVQEDDTAILLRHRMAGCVQKILTLSSAREIFIEGGATAAAVLTALGIKELQPVNEISRGVVRMQAGNLFVTFKPGSYALPAKIMSIFSHN